MLTTKELLLYIAGFFDGEGCVGYRKYCRIHKSGNTTNAARLEISVVQKDIEPLNLIKRLFGGNIYERQIKSGSIYTWSSSSKIARDFISSILPFLIVKRKQAIIALRRCRAAGLKIRPKYSLTMLG